MTIIRKDTNEAQEEIRRIIKDALVGTLIDERINSDAPELYDNSKVVLERRYLGKDREGNVLENFEDMFSGLRAIRFSNFNASFFYTYIWMK